MEALWKHPCPAACANQRRQPSLLVMTHKRWPHGQSGHESTGFVVLCVFGLQAWPTDTVHQVHGTRGVGAGPRGNHSNHRQTLHVVAAPHDDLGLRSSHRFAESRHHQRRGLAALCHRWRDRFSAHGRRGPQEKCVGPPFLENGVISGKGGGNGGGARGGGDGGGAIGLSIRSGEKRLRSPKRPSGQVPAE